MAKNPSAQSTNGINLIKSRQLKAGMTLESNFDESFT
jgi:hypothetical protein